MDDGESEVVRTCTYYEEGVGGGDIPRRSNLSLSDFARARRGWPPISLGRSLIEHFGDM